MMLNARGITKQFHYPQRLQLLNGIDLAVEQGESLAIMGRSGEGKSTLLHILGTLDSPSSGTLEIGGEPVQSSNVSRIRNHKIGFVFQSFHLMEDYTVLQNVLMPAWISRKPISEGSPTYLRAQALLDQVGLSERKDHFGKQLSGGEKQRVAIARALCNDPDLIFADEPSGNLDRKTAEGIHALLLSLLKGSRKSLVIVTHDPELASLCDKVYSLENGQLFLKA